MHENDPGVSFGFRGRKNERSIFPLPVSGKTTAGRAIHPSGREERKWEYPVLVLLSSLSFVLSIRFFLRVL